MHGTSWAAEGNKQSKQQTCLLLALLVPFRSPVNEIHWKTLGKSIKHCLHHTLHMYICAHEYIHIYIYIYIFKMFDFASRF